MSIEQGEHTFEVEVLISGETLPGYAAGEALSAGEPVEITGDYEVSSADYADVSTVRRVSIRPGAIGVTTTH